MANLTNREILILSYLEKHKIATSKELSEFLSVSDRTIKSDLKVIKNKLNNKEYEIKSIPGIGYEYHNYTAPTGNQYEDIYRDKDLIIHNYDRIAHIIQEFLVNNHYIKYEDLADKLFVSRSTLQKDMIKVKSLLNKFNLEFNQKPNYGVKVMGNESDIRSAMSYFFYNSFWGVLGESKLPDEYNRRIDVTNSIMTIIKEQVKHLYSLNENMIQNIGYQVIITLNRNNKENELDIKKSVDENILNISKKILDHSASLLALNPIGFKSINYIGNYILGFQLDGEHTEEIESLVQTIVDEIVNEVYKNFNIDFSNHTVLLGYLRTHIEQIIRRIKYKTPLYNPLILTYFRDYLFATKITISAVSILENIIDEVISIDEYGDFILFFQTALEVNSNKKIKIGLYTGNNVAEGILTYSSINSILDTNKYEMEYIKDLTNLNSFEIALTSYSLNETNSDAKIIKINFDKSNISNINNMIHNYNIEYNMGILRRYVHKDSIVVIDNDQKDELIETIIMYLESKGYLKDSSVKELIFHEIGNRSVHIQDLYKIMKKELCLFVILKKPVIWNKTVIENFFLIKTKKDGDVDLPYLCELFSNFINNPIAINSVRETPNYKDLIKELIESSKL